MVTHNGNGANKITVLLVDDHDILRQGVRALLAHENDIEVVGEADNGRSAIRLAEKHGPRVIVMDIVMPILNGLEASRQILHQFPDTRIVMLSAHDQDDYVNQLIRLGVTGYILKSSGIDELIKAIRQAAKGYAHFSPSIGKVLIDQTQRMLVSGKPPTSRREELTAREAEVLQLIAEGYPNKAIAGILYISIKTVEKHRQQLMNKLNLHDVASLTRYYLSTQGVFGNSGSHVQSSQPSLKRAPGCEHLSLDEIELVFHLAQGLNDAGIAVEMRRETSTIEKLHISLSEKLGLRTRADFKSYAVREGILEPDTKTA
jgi:DNA-binding NarL/FixJ family response regulator